MHLDWSRKNYCGHWPSFALCRWFMNKIAIKCHCESFPQKKQRLYWAKAKWILKEVHDWLQCMVLRYCSVLLTYSFSLCEQAEKLGVYLTMLLVVLLGAVNGRKANEDVCRRPLINGLGKWRYLMVFGQLTFSLGCLPAASQQASTRQLPKPLNMAICPKPLINGRQQTSSFAALPLTAPIIQIFDLSFTKNRLS